MIPNAADLIRFGRSELIRETHRLLDCVFLVRELKRARGRWHVGAAAPVREIIMLRTAGSSPVTQPIQVTGSFQLTRCDPEHLRKIYIELPRSRTLPRRSFETSTSRPCHSGSPRAMKPKTIKMLGGITANLPQDSNSSPWKPLQNPI